MTTIEEDLCYVERDIQLALENNNLSAEELDSRIRELYAKRHELTQQRISTNDNMQ